PSPAVDIAGALCGASRRIGTLFSKTWRRYGPWRTSWPRWRSDAATAAAGRCGDVQRQTVPRFRSKALFWVPAHAQERTEDVLEHVRKLHGARDVSGVAATHP